MCNRRLLKFKVRLVDFFDRLLYNIGTLVRFLPTCTFGGTMSLGENIYKYRTSKNHSQSELAELLDVSRQSVSKWENDSAVPDLDKLMRISKIYDISLDELVFGEKEVKTETVAAQSAEEPHRTSLTPVPTKWAVGMCMLVFGMVFFLLSVFWGDHLYFGEAFGELFSIVAVLVSISLIATDSMPTLFVCALIYFLYTVIYFSAFHVISIVNSLFIIVAGIVILVWFIVCGLKATKGHKFVSAVETEENDGE